MKKLTIILLAFLFFGKINAENPIKLGVCTSVNNYEKVEKAGFDYIEAGVTSFLVPEESEEKFLSNLAVLDKSKLKVYSCNVFLPGKFKICGDTIHHEEILKYAEVALARANKAGIQLIVYGSGGSRKVPEGFSKEKAKEQYLSLLKKLAKIAEKNKVILAVEPLNKKETNFINTIPEALEFVKEINSDYIKITADFYHMAVDDEPATDIELAGKYIGHCHIAEKENRAAPGTTNFDFSPYFKAVKNIGYKGNISIECRYTDFDSQLAPSCEYVKKLVNN